MKKILAFLVLIMILAAATSCTTANAENEENAAENNSFYLTGIVKSVSDCVEIEVIDSDYAFGIYWVLVSNETEITGADGGAISLSDISEGDKIEVVYSGQVMMSYPPQIAARKIRVK